MNLESVVGADSHRYRGTSHDSLSQPARGGAPSVNPRLGQYFWPGQKLIVSDLTPQLGGNRAHKFKSYKHPAHNLGEFVSYGQHYSYPKRVLSWDRAEHPWGIRHKPRQTNPDAQRYYLHRDNALRYNERPQLEPNDTVTRGPQWFWY